MPKTAIGLVIFLALAGAPPVFAQDASLYSTAESGGGSSPPRWEIGCAYAMSGHGSDVSVTVTLTWDAAGSGGSQTHTETGSGYLSGAITTLVDATVSDMTVTCDAMFTFSTFNQVIFRQSSAVIPGLRPIALHVDPTIPDQWTYTAPGDYLLWRSWQVYDRTGRWLFDGRPVNESYTIHQNGCNIVVRTAPGTTTQQGGRFGDKYGNYDGNSRIVACSMNPNCSTTSTQTLTVDGVNFSHSVDWGCYGVIIGRS